MMTFTFPDQGLHPRLATIHADGAADTFADILAGDAALDQALEQVFADGVRVVEGQCPDGDPLLPFWRRQLGRVVHTHPLVVSAFSAWDGDILRWRWVRAQARLSRSAPWSPFCDRSTWERTCVAPAAAAAPEPTREDVERARKQLKDMEARVRAGAKR